MRRRWFLVAVALVGVSGTSAAQERGHVAGVIGMTFGEQTAAMYGGQLGIGVADTFQVVGGIERLDDVLTGRYALLLSNISAITGVDVQGEVPATYYGAGARFTFPGLAASPYLEAQLGATQTDATRLVFLDRGDDVTDQLPPELRALLVETTSFTFVLSAGVRFDFGDYLLAEATFDFTDILTEREDIGLNRLNFAFGVRF